MSTTPPPVALAEELTTEWLSAALGHTVDSVQLSEVGTGQMGSCYRLALTGDPALPATVLAKLPTSDVGTREFLAASYSAEIRFYRELAYTVSITVPASYYAEIAEKGVFTLLLEDLAPCVPGDQIAGCTVEQAHDAVVNLAGLHGPRWCDKTLLDLPGLSATSEEDADLLAQTLGPTTEQVLEMLGELVSAEDAATLRAVAARVGPWLTGRSERFGLLHSDYRLDNLLFPATGRGVHAVDWQAVTLGLPGRDVAFFLGTGLDAGARVRAERDIVAAYHAALLETGVEDYALEECFDDYRYGMVQIPLITVYGCAYGSRTDRGDQMFAVMIQRGCAAIRDLGTLDLIAQAQP